LIMRQADQRQRQRTNSDAERQQKRRQRASDATSDALKRQRSANAKRAQFYNRRS
jgi:hypothetical protein